MRGIVSAAAGLAAALTWTMNAEAESPWYLEGAAGGYFRTAVSGPAAFHHNATPTVDVPGTNTVKFDGGPIVNIGVGYRLTPHLRLEGEVGYSTYTARSATPYTAAPGFPALDGQTFTRVSGNRWSRFTGAVNGFYDFAPLAGRITPYVGGGIGVSANRHANGTFASASRQTLATSGRGASTDGFGQLEAGASIALSPHWAVVPAYRYVHFIGDGADVAHVVKVGLRYAF